MTRHDKPATTGHADYDDAVLDAGWLPLPETVSPEPLTHPPRPSHAARDDAEAFLQGVYRRDGGVD